MGFTVSPEGFKYILHTVSCRQSPDSGPDTQLSLAPTHSPQRATCPGRNDAATSHSLGPMQTALPTTIRKVQGRMAGHSQALQTLDKTCHLPNPALPPPALPTPAGMGRSPGGKLTWYILGSPVRNLK